MMHVPTLIYSRIKGQRVRILCISFGDKSDKTYEGVVVGDYTTGFDLFIELDNGSIINTKYIETIEIMG